MNVTVYLHVIATQVCTAELACFQVTLYIFVLVHQSVFLDRSSLKQVVKVGSSRDGQTSWDRVTSLTSWQTEGRVRSEKQTGNKGDLL